MTVSDLLNEEDKRRRTPKDITEAIETGNFTKRQWGNEQAYDAEWLSKSLLYHWFRVDEATNSNRIDANENFPGTSTYTRHFNGSNFEEILEHEVPVDDDRINRENCIEILKDDELFNEITPDYETNGYDKLNNELEETELEETSSTDNDSIEIMNNRFYIIIVEDRNIISGTYEEIANKSKKLIENEVNKDNIEVKEIIITENNEWESNNILGDILEYLFNEGDIAVTS